MLAIIAAGAAMASQQGASQRDVANVMDATDKLGQGFTTLRYSKDKEREADQIGMVLLADAGINPVAYPSLWARKAAINGSGGSDFLSTHPIDSDRYTMAIHLLPLAQERAARITRQPEYPLKAPNQTDLKRHSPKDEGNQGKIRAAGVSHLRAQARTSRPTAPLDPTLRGFAPPIVSDILLRGRAEVERFYVLRRSRSPLKFANPPEIWLKTR